MLNETLTGITSGAIYASIALALVLIWRATRVVNFAAGAMAWSARSSPSASSRAAAATGWPSSAALGFGLVAGGVVERVLVRPVESKPPLNAVILTFGLLILIEAVAGHDLGCRRPVAARRRRSRSDGISIGGQTVALSPFDLFVIGAVVVVTMVLLVVLFRFTNVGLRMRASAFEPEVSRLLGVRVGRMLSLGWALAALVGALGRGARRPDGLLVART